MARLWIVESSSVKARLVDVLIGSLAVRAIASLESLQLLWRLHKSAPPSAVLVNCSGLISSADAEEEVRQQILGLAQMGPVLLHSSPSWHPSLTAAGVVDLGTSYDPMDLVPLLLNIVNQQPKAGCMMLGGAILEPHDLILTDAHSGDQVELTPKEAKLLRAFFARPGECINRTEIQSSAWGQTAVASRTIDSQISRLRKRLEPFGLSIESIYGGGYRLVS